MNMDTMREAARLTRAGRLGEATALLRRLLSGAPPPGSPEAPSSGPTLDLDPPPPGETGWRLGPDHAGGRAAPREAPADARADSGGAIGGLAGQLLKLRRRPAPEPDPAGSRFEHRIHAEAAGRRAYRLYVPSAYSGRPMPLLVMLHGCTQNPEDIAAGTRMNALAEEFGLIVAYPEQPDTANPQRCWNWFSAGDQRRDAGEPALIAGIARAVMNDLAVDPDRVFVAGMSAGGAAAAILGDAYPDLFSAVGVHSGLARGSAHDLPSALQAMKSGGPVVAPPGRGERRRVRAIVFHGDRDGVVAPVNGEQVMAQFAGGEGEAKVTRGPAPGGLTYTRIERGGSEHWTIHGQGHAWSGGSRAGTYADPRGPDASREMIRFFLGR